jgi:hypothetical protein
MARTKRFNDLTGKRFGKYTVVSHVIGQHWLCRCDCGVEKTLFSPNFTTSKSPMCRDCADTERIIDLTGQRFGKWTVLSLAKPNFWNCRCDCGTESVVSRGNLRSGGSTQCQKCCYANRPTTHGHALGTGISPTYQVWISIKQRCLYPNDTSYPHYGGKGVCMCKGWQESFPLFLELMGERTSQRLSIDRANTDESTRHYSCGQCDECKENGWIFHCRWATKSEQSKNRIVPARKFYTFEGKTLSLKEWSQVTGVPLATLSGRLTNYGWSIERTLSTPPRTYDKQN